MLSPIAEDSLFYKYSQSLAQNEYDISNTRGATVEIGKSWVQTVNGAVGFVSQLQSDGKYCFYAKSKIPLQSGSVISGEETYVLKSVVNVGGKFAPVRTDGTWDVYAQSLSFNLNDTGNNQTLVTTSQAKAWAALSGAPAFVRQQTASGTAPVYLKSAVNFLQSDPSNKIIPGEETFVLKTYVPATSTTPTPTPPTSTVPQTLDGKTLVWNDEFEGSSLDKSKWKAYTGDVYNNEVQTYTSSGNYTISEGSLNLVAKANLTSAKIQTQGLFTFKEGATVVGRFKFSGATPGVWPAFWAMGDNSWKSGKPDAGEIDIFEYGPSTWGAGNIQSAVQTNRDYYATSTFRNALVALDVTQWFTVKLAWESSSIKVYFNDKLGFTYTNDGDPSAWPKEAMSHAIELLTALQNSEPTSTVEAQALFDATKRFVVFLDDIEAHEADYDSFLNVVGPVSDAYRGVRKQESRELGIDESHSVSGGSDGGPAVALEKAAKLKRAVNKYNVTLSTELAAFLQWNTGEEYDRKTVIDEVRKHITARKCGVVTDGKLTWQQYVFDENSSDLQELLGTPKGKAKIGADYVDAHTPLSLGLELKHHFITENKVEDANKPQLSRKASKRVAGTGKGRGVHAVKQSIEETSV
ncbi:hypothetical protein HDU93_002353 [Gonapodya sp. JEL0774]|nr:hypothetical protein HDU93_002353 [Gonapodya sp. JEL0774]